MVYFRCVYTDGQINTTIFFKASQWTPRDGKQHWSTKKWGWNFDQKWEDKEDEEEEEEEAPEEIIIEPDLGACVYNIGETGRDPFESYDVEDYSDCQ